MPRKEGHHTIITRKNTENQKDSSSTENSKNDDNENTPNLIPVAVETSSGLFSLMTVNEVYEETNVWKVQGGRGILPLETIALALVVADDEERLDIVWCLDLALQLSLTEGEREFFVRAQALQDNTREKKAGEERHHPWMNVACGLIPNWHNFSRDMGEEFNKIATNNICQGNHFTLSILLFTGYLQFAGGRYYEAACACFSERLGKDSLGEGAGYLGLVLGQLGDVSALHHALEEYSKMNECIFDAEIMIAFAKLSATLFEQISFLRHLFWLKPEEVHSHSKEEEEEGRWRKSSISEKLLRVGKEMASKYNSLDLIQCPLQCYDTPPLIIACQRGFAEVVQVLCQVGDGAKDIGPHALVLACRKGNLKIVGILIKEGHPKQLDCNMTDSVSKDTPLFAAAQAGHLKVVKYLLEHGVDPDGQHGKHLRTPLLEACFGNQLEIVKVLVKCGADLSIQDSFGDSPELMLSEAGNETLKSVVEEAQAQRRCANQRIKEENF